MNDFSSPSDDCSFGYESLEAVVRSAGVYVHPTEDLRPRTMEAARAANGQRRLYNRLGSLVLCLMLAVTSGLPGILARLHFGPTEGSAQAVRQFDLHQQATMRILHAGLDPTWAVYEAFAQLRSQQAELFEDSM